MINIKIGNKDYSVREAKTDEELEKGLSGIDSISENEGMLFYMPDESPQQTFTMEGMKFPLDIIFINQDLEVIDIKENCQPNEKLIVNSTKNMSEDDYVAYVLEVNTNSGIKVNDELDFEESSPIMKVLALDGSTLMELFGGERIVSRRETKILIKKAKKAEKSKDDKDYKALGRYFFKVIKGLEERPIEYVDGPK